MASSPPVDSESSGSNARFNYRKIFKSALDGYNLSRSSSEASCSVNLRDIFKSASNGYNLSSSSSNASVNLREISKMSSSSDENGSEENGSEENGNNEDDSDEEDIEEEDGEEEDSEENDIDESGTTESDSDDDDDSFTSCDEVKLRIPTAEDFENLPFRVTTCGPPQVDTKLYTDMMRFFFNPIRCFWEPIWIIQPDVDIITDMIRPYARLCGLPNEDISVEFLSKGSWNSVYVVSSADKSSQCVFRCALPSNPWFRMQLEVSTMDYVRRALPPDEDPSTIPMPPAADEAFARAANHMYTHDAIANVPAYALALQSLLPLCAGATAPFDGAAHPTYLYHNDIHAGNIMVDGSGRPIALLDWEGVYACPHDWTERYPPLIDEADYRDPVRHGGGESGDGVAADGRGGKGGGAEGVEQRAAAARVRRAAAGVGFGGGEGARGR